MKRTIIITGGTTGIGKATAYQFATNGWNVVITSRSEKKGNAFVEEAKNEGLDMTFFQLDVTNEEQVAQVIEQTVAKSASWTALSTTLVFRLVLHRWLTPRPTSSSSSWTPTCWAFITA